MDLAKGIQKQQADDAYALANGAMVKQYHWPDAADSMESSIDYLLQTVAKQKPYVQFLLGFGCGWISGYLFKAAVTTVVVAGGIGLAIVAVKGYHIKWNIVHQNIVEGTRELSASSGGQIVQSINSKAMLIKYKYVTIGFGSGILLSLFPVKQWIL